jgi:diguanylate cyclase
MSIERSTELLRQALPWMSRQQAGLHPVSYAIWFDYVARSNPPLRAAIDEHLAREGALDEFATHALFTRHVADVAPETAQRMVDEMQRVLGGIGETAGSAASHAARYGASLARLAGVLARGDTARGIDDAEPGSAAAFNAPSPRHLADVVAEVIADTGTMRSQIGGLQQRLADSRREIDRLRDEVRRAREDALRDSLTGLSNRRAFDQALAACLAAPASSGPWLLLSDIDHFQRINDHYGRDFGDQVLKAVAEALRTLVPAGARLARVDGEAFGLLVPDIDAGAALALAERVRAHIGSARIRRPDQGETEAERVTLSLGLAGGRAGEAPEALLERATAALRRAKDGGRDRVVAA